MKSSAKAVIIGAGPAGLTAAYELVTRTNIKPIIFEATNDIGGIAKTVNYKGNRMDIGGHRFFSKSQRVVSWWQNIFPLANDAEPTNAKVMLIRDRVSRIYYLRQFFAYPISLSWETFKKLGLWRVIKIGASYLKVRLFPLKEEKSLEDFFINRFGRELYQTFFKDYTEKVWGISCNAIKPEWGAQRIKGLSISKAISHAVQKLLLPKKIRRNIETSLIDEFIYPKYGPGQLWEEVAAIILAKGGVIHRNSTVTAISWCDNLISGVEVLMHGELKTFNGDYYFSTMPVKDLISCSKSLVPEEVKHIAAGLMYRDFITVGLLLNKLKIKEKNWKIIPDNWIYVQERDVKLGRVQVFNNWSPFLVADPDKVWLGLEYFCNEGDELWSKSDENFLNFAIAELIKIDFISPEDVLDGVVVRMPKTYPAYFGSYASFEIVKKYLDQFANLFLIGRNGMHRYNNMDHSMLTAMVAVDNIIAGVATKDNIWAVNTEDEYHEKNN